MLLPATTTQMPARPVTSDGHVLPGVQVSVQTNPDCVAPAMTSARWHDDVPKHVSLLGSQLRYRSTELVRMTHPVAPLATMANVIAATPQVRVPISSLLGDRLAPLRRRRAPTLFVL